MGFWNDDNVAALRALWAQGASGKEIAQLLGASRNAVLGKVYRLDLALHHGRSAKGTNAMKARAAASASKKWAHGKPQSNPEHVCRFRDCMKSGTGKPPYCDIHRPAEKPKTAIPWEIPPGRLRAGRA